MAELVFVKLGGSLITDKTRPKTVRRDVLERLAREIAHALAERPELRLIVGHGSGSYGHAIGAKYGTREGVFTADAWRGYAETAVVAAQLHRLVVDALWAAGVPALPVQPSASARSRGGDLREMDDGPLQAGLAHGLVPVVYGDVALDDSQGGTIISTEQIFRWLAPRLGARRIILAGEVEGVLSADPASGRPAYLIPVITSGGLSELSSALGGSRGVDVTGGMLGKVAEMVALLREAPALEVVQVISGLCAGLLADVLLDPALHAGTRIRSGA